MDDAPVRLLLIALVVLVGTGAGLLARRRFVYHAPLDITDVGFGSGIVVFTSTSCDRCKEVLAIAKGTGAPVREVTYEIEAGLQEQVGVTGVPLTLVVDRSGRAAAQFAGSVSARRLRLALRRAGL